MLSLRALLPSGRPPVVLCVGAHADDVEIGCGGTLQVLLEDVPEAEVHWLVLTGADERAREVEASARLFLGGAGAGRLVLGGLRDGYLPHEAARAKDLFESVKAELRPELVLTHHGDDAHQDHRLASELTWNTWRDAMILEYEVPKWDGDLSRPNLYVPLSAEQLHRKTERLQAVYGSQRSKDWFDDEVFRGLARLRGMECRADSGYAEAFHARKLLLGGFAR